MKGLGSIGIAKGMTSFAPRGVEGGSFAGFAKIGPVGLPVNEGPMSRAAVGISRVEAKFAPHRIEPLSAPKAPAIRTKVPDIFYQAFEGKNLDPAKPARQLVPDVKPKIEQTRPLESALATLPYVIATQLRQELSVTKLVSPQVKIASVPQLVAVAKPEIKLVQIEERREKKIVREEKSDKDESVFIEDDPVNEQRILDLVEAEKLLDSQANEGEVIDAAQLVTILPGEDESRRSGIIKKKGPDGGYKKYIEALKRVGKFSTVRALISYALEQLRKNTAVAFGKDGKKVGDKEVVNVLDSGLLERESVVEVARRLVRLEKPGKIEVSGGVVKIEYEPEKTEKIVEVKQTSTPIAKDSPSWIYLDRLSKLVPKSPSLIPKTAF